MANPRFYVRDYGTPRVVGTRLIGNGKQTETTDRVMGYLITDLMNQTKKQFSSKGARSGDPWPALQPNTVKRKGHSKILKTSPMRPNYERPSINHDALFRSVTVRDAPYQYKKLTKTGFQFGTRRPLAGANQRGGGRVPARPFLVVTPEDEERWKGILARHLTIKTRKTNQIGENA